MDEGNREMTVTYRAIPLSFSFICQTRAISGGWEGDAAGERGPGVRGIEGNYDQGRERKEG